MKAALVLLFFASVAIGNTFALECYMCDENGCFDPFNPGPDQETCEDSIYNYCTKVITTIAGVPAVARGCITQCTEDCFGDTCVYCCTSNLCNHGSAVTSSIIAITTSALVAYYFSK